MSQVKIITSLFFFLFALSQVAGQSLSRELTTLPSEERSELAQRHTNNLAEATLIIILPFHERKINQLNEWLADSETPEQRIPRIEKLLEKTISDRDSLNMDYLRNFPEAYTFSKVEFLYNKDLNKFLEAGTYEYFLNSEGEYKGSKNSFQENVYFGHLYRERGEDTAGGHYFVISDNDFKIIPKPFPSYFNLENTFINILTFWSGNSYQVPAEKIASKVQKKLENIKS